MRRAWLCLTPIALAVLLLGADPGYREAIQEWRRLREQKLQADGGWLSVAGLFWLKPGPNTAGSDPGSDFVLPAGASPARAGVFFLKGGDIRFTPGPDAVVTARGNRFSERTMRPDTDGGEDPIEIGRLRLFAVRRGGRLGIRLIDNQSDAKRKFHGLRWYPVDPAWRITARFEAYPVPKEVSILNVLGDREPMTSLGVAVFHVNGKTARLEAIREDEELFFIFRDRTAGKETYPAGRFLYTSLPKSGQVVLDFNKAYTPPCAFTPYATCPLPPPQNRLDLKITAGELNPH